MAELGRLARDGVEQFGLHEESSIEDVSFD
jgi:hypothetical protein